MLVSKDMFMIIFTYLSYNFVNERRKNAGDILVIGIRDRVIVKVDCKRISCQY